jgi:hypothetical protein
MIDQGHRMRSRIAGTNHDGLESLLPCPGCGNTQLLLDEILRDEGENKNMQQEKHERYSAGSYHGARGQMNPRR